MSDRKFFKDNKNFDIQKMRIQNNQNGTVPKTSESSKRRKCRRDQNRNTDRLMNKSFRVEIKHPSLLEAASHIKQIQLKRTSSPNGELCEHCPHDHALKCCMYIYDDYADILRYSNFKKEVERPYILKYINKGKDFDLPIFGNVTPHFFPFFSENNPNRLEQEMMKNYQQPPVIYLRQYIWPILLPPRIHHLPMQNINLYRNPFDLKYHPPSNSLPYSYHPIIMNQIPISLQAGNFAPNQFIDSHSFVPIPHCWPRP